ncbi:hypothetical protein CA54_05270 [Symmachiella macrocystis]|uniref:Uncharacterized protein n=1 Tax=Symmachiella macrocystis TaxID=2527985 RepID=A0A5C6BI32_9PLAN|nr:hypothetical protein CA54_05270 [Symmachiella macrocystis]
MIAKQNQGLSSNVARTDFPNNNLALGQNTSRLPHFLNTSSSEIPRQLRTHAADLLSQQCWCWGQDILRAEGNWLLELGFKRIRPPKKRKDCSSVYQLELSGGQSVVLRGFGVFFGDRARGGVFLPRYEFTPRFTSQFPLVSPPWSTSDLPALWTPTGDDLSLCAKLTLDLIDWIRSYEVNVIRCLGLEYRQATLSEWQDDKRKFFPAEQFASAWRELSLQIAGHSESLISAKTESATPP